MEPADAGELLRLRRSSLAAAPWAFASGPDSDRLKEIDAARSTLEVLAMTKPSSGPFNGGSSEWSD